MLRRFLLGMFAGLVFLTGASAGAAGGAAERASVSSQGSEANRGSWRASVSGDGRLVAFASAATNLSDLDGDTRADVYLRDRAAGTTELISASYLFGTSLGDGDSDEPFISSDGSAIAFTSTSELLVPDDENDLRDVFVHDRATGSTVLISAAPDGTGANGASSEPSLSADGRFVAFVSSASNLVPGDTNARSDVFVHDRETGRTIRVSVADDGTQANGASFYSSISDDGSAVSFASTSSNLTGHPAAPVGVYLRDLGAGRTEPISIDPAGARADGLSWRSDLSSDGSVVVFWSDAGNLVEGDSNGLADVFVRDRRAGRTTRVSVSTSGDQGDGSSAWPSISADGRIVVFESSATTFAGVLERSSLGIYAHDRLVGATSLVSKGQGGLPLLGSARFPAVSADGGVVVFESDAPNVVVPDLNRTSDIFAVTR